VGEIHWCFENRSSDAGDAFPRVLGEFRKLVLRLLLFFCLQDFGEKKRIVAYALRNGSEGTKCG
jgi:hypothetical protein